MDREAKLIAEAYSKNILLEAFQWNVKKALAKLNTYKAIGIIEKRIFELLGSSYREKETGMKLDQVSINEGSHTFWEEDDPNSIRVLVTLARRVPYQSVADQVTIIVTINPKNLTTKNKLFRAVNQAVFEYLKPSIDEYNIDQETKDVWKGVIEEL